MEERESEIGQRLSEVDVLEVEVEKLIAGGEGLARFEGIPVFISRAAPGDRLKVRVTERKPSFARAEIEEILTPGPGRREPPCPHFERCGSCDLQHLDEETQLRAKVEAVRENLLRLGRFEVPDDVTIVPGQPWGYRLRTQLHIAPTDRGNRVGYFARGTHDLVPIDQCPVLVPEIEEQLSWLNRRVRDVDHRRIDVTSGGEELTISPAIPGLPRGEVSLEVEGDVFTLDAGCFFQGHRQLLPVLVSHAVGELSGVEGDPEGEAFDLYAGVGLMTLTLARRYSTVTAVEGDRPAVRYGKKNARQNKLSNVSFENQAVETWAEEHLPEGAARVVVDPPRPGLSKAVRRALLDKRPRHLTYVSCNSATLARDLAELGEIYRASKLVLIDLFPQTGHLEAIVQLELKGAEPTEPESTEMESTEVESTGPESTEPEPAEPESTEPEAKEPESTEPESSEPESTEPESTEPESTEPESTEPESTEPVPTKPGEE